MIIHNNANPVFCSFLLFSGVVMAVEVSDTVPVVAFGFPVPLFQDK